jgi:mitochondrial fission protein ELM1
VVTDGKAGMENQCLGLAEALRLEPTVFHVALHEPWRSLAPHLRVGLSRAFDRPFSPPWPELVIATGRQSVPASLYIGQRSQRTWRVQIQNPGIHPRKFALVIAPMHDGLRGVNVIQTVGALHRATPERLAADSAAFASRIAHLPHPRIGVLLGGTSGVYRFGADEARALAKELRQQVSCLGGSFLLTPSRRTGEDNVAILRDGLAGTPGFFWDGTGDNPYFGILGSADVLLVTGDSVNMLTEACASGHPVYVYALPGGSSKSERFQEALFLRGYARPYRGSLEPQPTSRLYEMSRIARAVEAMS